MKQSNRLPIHRQNHLWVLNEYGEFNGKKRIVLEMYDQMKMENHRGSCFSLLPVLISDVQNISVRRSKTRKNLIKLIHNTFLSMAV